MPSAATLRWHRHRQRKRNGRVLLEIEADETALELLLARHGLLSFGGAQDHAELATALAKLVERLIAADAEQHWSEK
jgi:hypothetical protein